MRNLTPAERGYAAGVLDGEGGISIWRNQGRSSQQWQLRVSVTNSDPRMLAWFHERFGGRVKIKRRGNSKANWRPVFEWCADTSAAEAVLVQTLPFLVIKREQAEIALEFRALLKQSPAGSLRDRERGRFGSLSTEQVEQRQILKSRLHLLHHKSYAVAGA